MKTFEELGVSQPIIKAITEMGYEQPMPVQEEVIPYLLGNDNEVIALAQTGTGKTAAFGLPIIQGIKVDVHKPQAVILCPTRELCLQIADDLTEYSKYIDNLKVLPVYGGSSIESQIRMLKKGVHIIVATPGRLIDLLNRKTVSLDLVRNVVLDEADEMLNMGFSESIDEILAEVPDTRNMLLFSATMPNGIKSITKKYMRSPKEITIGKKNEGTKNVKHIYYMVHAKDKYLALKRIADYYPNIYGIIFCRTRKETQEIADLLIKDGYNADSLHGDLSQQQRDYVMNKFRIRNLQLLVATDVAARGLDVDDLTHIINYGLPDDIESYTHRSGRTGRAGKTGTSISIIHLREKHKVREIEKILNRPFEEGKIPTGKEICEKQLFNLVDKIEKVKVNEEEIQSVMPSIYRKLDWLDKEDVLKRIISVEFNRMLEYYQDAGDIETPQEISKKRDRGFTDSGSRRNKNRSNEGTARTAETGYARLFINVGKTDGINPASLIGMINDALPNKKIAVGRIDLMKTFSFFEVKNGDAQKVVNAMQRGEYKGRRISVEIAQEKPSENREKSRKDYGNGDRKKNKKGDFGRDSRKRKNK